MEEKKLLLEKLADCVENMEDEEVVDVAEEYLAKGYDALDGIISGLVVGMQKAATLYEEEEYFIPELLLCSDAMYQGLDILKAKLEQEETDEKSKIVIGVVEGDTHDIGKNLVRIMLETAGYELYDLGRDVPLKDFVDKAKEVGADVIAMSTLMSTAMPNMKKVVDLVVEAGIRDDVKIIVGGGPISVSFAEKIGADGYSSNAIEAVKLVDRLLGKKAS
ncbi:corrinoid protein [Lachnospiraceae bacterium LCP25S3_G4]